MKRARRPSILIGITLYQPTDDFLVSLLCFLEEIKDHYDIEVVEVKDKELVEAQNIIADKFLESDKEYLLMLECDHSGHSRNMLKALLRSNTEVCGQHYYSRHFPYYSCCMRGTGGISEHGGPLFAGLHNKSGYAECDLLGYGMTLYKRSVFEKLEKPYFRINDFGGPGCIATDIDFSTRLKKVGVKLIGCFDYTLNHRYVNAKNVMNLRIEGIKMGRSNLLRKKGYQV